MALFSKLPRRSLLYVVPVLTAFVLSLGAVTVMLLRIDNSNDEFRAEVEKELLIGEMAAAVEEASVIIAAWTAETSGMAMETHDLEETDDPMASMTDDPTASMTDPMASMTDDPMASMIDDQDGGDFSQAPTASPASELDWLLAAPQERFTAASGSLSKIMSANEQVVLDQAITAYALLMDSAGELIVLEGDDNDVMAAYHGSTQLVEGDLRSALDKLRIQSSRRVEGSIADVSLAETAIRALLPILALAALGSALVLSKLSSARRRASTLEQLVTAKDEFIASVSHELRTPLTGVLGFAVELEERIQASGDREESEMIAIVVDQAQQAAFLVEDLLVVARSDIGRIEIVRKPAELGPLAESVLGEGGFRHLSKLNSIRVDAKSVVAYADPYRIRQIVRNLLTNAVRYGGDEVSVNIHQVGNTATLQVKTTDPVCRPDSANKYSSHT